VKGTVTEIDLDDDGTAHAWEAETTAANGTDADWRVDLRTGAVTPDRSSHDDGDDDGRDHDATRATHDAGDDHGRDNTATHDAGDDHGDHDRGHDADDDHGHHGDDD
jgi:hypothetical protein